MTAARRPFSLLCLAFALATSPGAMAQDAPAGEGWIPLFNGKDLTGWTPKITGFEAGENFADTFRVEDGLLKVSFDGYDEFGGKFGHLVSDQSFSNYRLRVEYRFVGDQCPGGPSWAIRNSGAMIHSQSAASMRKDQDFPVSIEVQFLGGLEEGERPTANLCTPGTHVVMDGELLTRHCTNSTSKTYRGDQWVTVEVEVHGDEVIRHLVDGEVVIEYEMPQLDPDDPDARRLLRGDKELRGGHIALQSESHPIEFRKVELLPLD
jgi:hypothetical protein